MIGATIGRCVVVLALVGGCFEPNYVQGLYCSEKSDCPPNQVCVFPENRCYEDALLGDGGVRLIDASSGPDAFESNVCDPLTQTGCQANNKCTWIMDQQSPYVGHIGCVPAGPAGLGDTCMMSGLTPAYDNCAKGLVCGNFRGTGAGTCKAICDHQGGPPTCVATHTCVTYADLFSSGGVPAAGVCDAVCNPLLDNDFDGAGTSSTKAQNTCGSANAGCYGSPSYGTPPVTAWSCTSDVNFDVAQPLGLRHRVACTTGTNCLDPAGMPFTNSCNQGYVPLLYEQTGSTQSICVAICKPAPCYSGSCGTSNTNRNGDPASVHQCVNPDRMGTFAATEHCQYLWWRETDDSGNLLLSPTSDTVGFCMDFAKYRYDSNQDNKLDGSDLFLPNCDQLGSGAVVGGNPSVPTAFFGAVDLGCVPTAFISGAATGKGKLSPETLRKRALLDLPRALYRRTARDTP